VTDEQIRLWAAEDAEDVVRKVRNYLLKCRTHQNTAQHRAEVAAHEGLLRVLEYYSASAFQSRAHFHNTVVRVALNWAITEYGRRCGGNPLPLGEFDLADPGSEPEENWTDDCMKQFLAAFGKLDREDRELLVLKFVEGRTLEDIAERTGSTLNRVWYRINALRERLRREIERGCDASDDRDKRARP
jgi:RNA polymerase sigma factor (sigma-70 family)